MKNLKNMITTVFVNFFFVLLILQIVQNYAQIQSLVGIVPTTPSVTPEQVVEVSVVAANTIPPTKPIATKALPAPTKDPRCIITVSGARYNVTQLRSSHSGGNIFRCGTDMTAVYKGQHGSSTSLIARYRI